MTPPTSAVALALLLLPTQATPTDRPRSIIAPSIPQLSVEEEKALDAKIDLFMKADVGDLPGPEVPQAVRDFQAMGPEAVPALIRGLNRAAEINHSCPTLQLTRKLMGLLTKSTDVELIEFARDNIGAGVSDRSRHLAALRSLRTQLMLHQNAVVRNNPPAGRLTTPAVTPPPAELGGRDPKTLKTPELARLAQRESGEPLVRILRELGTRSDPEALAALANRAANSTSDVRELSRDLLQKSVARLDVRDVLPLLDHADAEVRRTAVTAILDKHPASLGKLIDRVADADDGIRQQVRQALTRELRTVDFGPEPNADAAEARRARDRWRAYWDLNRR